MGCTFNSTDLDGLTRDKATSGYRSRLIQAPRLNFFACEAVPEIEPDLPYAIEYSWTTVRTHADYAAALAFKTGHPLSLVGVGTATIDGTSFAQAAFSNVSVDEVLGVTTTTRYTLICTDYTG